MIDVRRAFDFLHLEKGVDASQIAIMGQSLGTGIGTALAARLEGEGESNFGSIGERLIEYVATGIKARALILIAPFSSIATLLETYKLGTFTMMSILVVGRRLNDQVGIQVTTSPSFRLFEDSPGFSTISSSCSAQSLTRNLSYR